MRLCVAARVRAPVVNTESENNLQNRFTGQIHFIPSGVIHSSQHCLSLRCQVRLLSSYLIPLLLMVWALHTPLPATSKAAPL